jgi:hypothetical protein
MKSLKVRGIGSCMRDLSNATRNFTGIFQFSPMRQAETTGPYKQFLVKIVDFHV